MVRLAAAAGAGLASVKRTAEIRDSGRFQSDLAMRKDGEVYHCGDGSADVDIKTASGSIDLCRGAGGFLEIVRKTTVRPFGPDSGLCMRGAMHGGG